MNADAYLAGVLQGTGWCSDSTIGLRVKDQDFAATFAVAVELLTGCTAHPHLDGACWRVTARNTGGRFSHLCGYEPADDGERAAWIGGLFDSAGTAQLRRTPGARADAWHRRVAIAATELSTLERANRYLVGLGIPASIRPRTAAPGLAGPQQGYELAVEPTRDAFLRFAWLVGSSCTRKRRTLLTLPLSYQVDPVASMRAAQRVAVTAMRRKTMESTLPRVVDGVRGLLAQGIKPTQRTCAARVPGFPSVQRYVSMGELVRLASDP